MTLFTGTNLQTVIDDKTLIGQVIDRDTTYNAYYNNKLEAVLLDDNIGEMHAIFFGEYEEYSLLYDYVKYGTDNGWFKPVLSERESKAEVLGHSSYLHDLEQGYQKMEEVIRTYGVMAAKSLYSKQHPFGWEARYTSDHYQASGKVQAIDHHSEY